MTYDEFKAAFLLALRDVGLPTMGPPPHEETLCLKSTDRTVVVYVEPLARDIGGQFHVSGTISWHWDALLAARTRTTEEDLLRELLGQEEADAETEPPVLRIDIKLRASLMPGKEIPMPSASTWAKWSKEAITRLDRVEPLIPPEDPIEETVDGGFAILAWQGDPVIKATCDAAGILKLSSISVSAFQLVEVPRHWDDSEREDDPHPHAQLRALLARVKAALFAWGEVMDHFR